MANINRIFVGNLPTDIIEKDIKNEFSAYGTVSKVEIKHKRDPLTNDVMSTFAFVTISITDSDLDQCLLEFKNEKFRGRYLTVTVARENFMEKLKREREEASHGSSLNNTPEISNSQFEKPKIKKNVQIIQANSFDSSPTSTSKNPFIEPEIVVKRKSKVFMENGKIKIPSIDSNTSSNIIIQPSPKVERKNLDEKSLKADQRRLESLIKMKNTYNQQKKAVQQSLSSIDTTLQNKKIIFDKPIDKIENVKSQSKPLFEDNDDDDSDYEKDFEIKKQYQGEKGARLQKLQSRFQNDQRFTMNEKFLDDNDDVEEEEDVTDHAESKNDERKWQYDMLESVMGKKMQPEEKKKSDNPMLRYDPTRNDHVKYEKVRKRKNNSNGTDLEPTKSSKLNDETDFEVSKEQFYKVTNQLTSSLLPSSEGFSLLSMFGRGTDIVENQPKNPYKGILLTKGQQQSLTNSNVFDDESSDEEIIQKPLTSSKDHPVNHSKQNNSKKTAKSDIWHEPFFIFGNDQRLQDGLSMFLQNESNEGIQVEFESKQKEMRNIIKKKIKKSIKSVLPRGGKPNKRFGRLVKNI